MAIVNNPIPTPPPTVTPPKKPQPCCCPACSGLECLNRPRYFAGQLLTEADFNSEQAYNLAKNRLHNRYLHGSGVVCGLEVVCNACGEGTVTVQAGYAIDPCGNDVIVCEPVALDVVKAITECCTRKRRPAPGCNPYEPPPSEACKDVEQNWCITIEYQERESRGVMPLGGKTCGCGGSGGCGCGGSKGSGGCGCGKSSQKSKNGTAACASPRAGQQRSAQCEPTRIREGYKLCVVEESEDCSSRPAVSEGTLLANIRDCIQGLQSFMGQLTSQAVGILTTLQAGGAPSATQPQIRDAVCRMRQALIDRIKASDYITHCGLLADIPACPAAGAPIGQFQSAVQTMTSILEQTFLDCICHALLPQCGADPCDDRLILACVTVINGKVARICNFSCRKYAGSFPALFYWLSGFPLANQILTQFRRLCCDAGIFERLDPAGEFRLAARAGAYAAPAALAANLETMLNQVSLENFVGMASPGAVSLPTLVGMPSQQALATLRASQVNVVERTVETAKDAPPSTSGNVFASPGGAVIAYIAGGAIAGFAPYDLGAQLADTRAELAELRGLIAKKTS
jgi:hypothetical protein